MFAPQTFYFNFLDKRGDIKKPGGLKVKGVYQYHELRSRVILEELRNVLDSIVESAIDRGFRLVVTKKRFCFKRHFNEITISPNKKSLIIYIRKSACNDNEVFRIDSVESSKVFLAKLKDGASFVSLRPFVSV